MNFLELLRDRWKQKTFLCVGLDTDAQKIPSAFQGQPKPLFEFNKMVVDATIDLVCAYKPQIAYYAAQAAEDQLQMTIDYIHQKANGRVPVILDSKRGDIGETAALYAREAFERYEADAVTVNPYMGGETLEPFLSYKDRGVIVLCKTSNPGSLEFQNLECNSKTIYEIVAETATKHWNRNGNVGLVVGATQLAELQKVRAIAPDLPLLVPGIGAQGGDLQGVLDVGRDRNGEGLIINSSRAIIYAKGDDPQAAVRAAALSVVKTMRAE